VVCGETDIDVLVLDHLVPISRGQRRTVHGRIKPVVYRADDPNLQVLCVNDHARKNATEQRAREARASIPPDERTS
jgi:5-methylcytosine-specific restriction endonuclease McrA